MRGMGRNSASGSAHLTVQIMVARLHRFNWDQVIALSYAAEQVFVAAQLLTSDTVSLEEAVRRSSQHLKRLLEHRALLPSYLITWAAECIESCRVAAQTPVDRARTQQLATAILQLLEEVRHVLNQARESETAQPQPRAA